MENLMSSLLSLRTTIGPPRRAVRKLIARQRRRFHLDAVPGRRWRHVAVAFHHHRSDEVFMKMIYVFQYAILQRPTDGDIVEDRKMLYILTQAHSTSMWTNRHPELCRHEQHGQHLIDAAQATAIDLAETNGAGLQQLLVHDAAVAVFAGGHPDRRNRAGD